MWHADKNARMGKTMATVTFIDDDFRRMPRADMARLQKLIADKKFGIQEIPYGDKKIKVEIKKVNDKIVVKKFRVM